MSKNTRKKILESAKKYFAQFGFQATSLTKISDDVGIKKASLYHFFESKESIYLALIADLQKEILKVLEKSEEKIPHLTLSMFVEHMLVFGVENRMILGQKDLFQMKQQDSETMKHIIAGFQDIESKIVDILAKYEVQQPENAASIVLLTMQSYIQKYEYCKQELPKIQELSIYLEEILLK